jgi:hypothetical protein
VSEAAAIELIYKNAGGRYVLHLNFETSRCEMSHMQNISLII